MAGRPPLPIAIRAQQGDTRKLGANKFAEKIESAHEPQRGRPPYPAALKCPTRPADPEKLEQWKATQARLVIARTHWEYLADQLENERMLAECDEGMLTGMALSYALAIEAARDGRDRAYVTHWKAYMQGASLMGLNESSRARLPKKGAAEMNDLDKAMCS